MLKRVFNSLCGVLLLMCCSLGLAEESNPASQDSNPVQEQSRKARKKFFPGIPLGYPSTMPKGVYNVGCEQPMSEAEKKAESDYKLSLYPKILQNWVIPANYQGEKPILGITIEPTGELREIRVLKSSGDAAMDAEAIHAVQKSAPFGPLPTVGEERPPALEQVISYEVAQLKTNPRSEAEMDRLSKSLGNHIPRWIGEINKTIIARWTPPTNQTSNKQVIVVMLVDMKSGRIYKRKISVTSCDPEMDKAALAAIDASSPLPIPAPGFVYLADVITVEYVFNNEVSFIRRAKPSKP